MRLKHVTHGAQCVDGQRRNIRDREPARRGFRHPAGDAEVDAVRASNRDWDVDVPRLADDVEFCAGEWMEGVVNPDSQRLGIVECCS